VERRGVEDHVASLGSCGEEDGATKVAMTAEAEMQKLPPLGSF